MISLSLGLSSQSRSRLLLSVVFLMFVIVINEQVVFAQKTAGLEDQKTVDEIQKRQAALLDCKRVVFLGDSNTHSGTFISLIESTLLANFETVPELVNLGLSSETCSGLTEPSHPFPRPDVHERLDRVFEKTKPDMVIACYGMNDAIYAPFDETRFNKFKSGIERLIEKTKKQGAKLVLVTPPPFDAFALKETDSLVKADAELFAWTHVYENYEDEVIAKYAQWMNANCKDNEAVFALLDAHAMLKEFIRKKREKDSEYSNYSSDGVHFLMDGHRSLARGFLSSFGIDHELVDEKTFFDSVNARQSITHLAWLTHVGHLRPKVAPGIPFDEVAEKVKPITEKIEQSKLRKKSN